ncbi:hypothetical protein HD554DRAFT_2091334 [Boletus coccyginus]|nr:hypothetical protein HD554DRAFT_2091334 [Boletus coccyginus]
MNVLNLFSQRSLLLFHILPFICHEVAANTEIINFSSTREFVVDLPLDAVGNWSKLHPTDNERQWSLEPAALHTPLRQVCEQINESWASYSSFTLRLSWPASVPADFAIALYSPQDLLARLSERELISNGIRERARPHVRASPHTSSTRHTPTTRSRYARIRAVDAGVPTPGSRPQSPPAAPAPAPAPALAPVTPLPRVPVPHPGSDAPADADRVVPFVVILEPAYLGVLPATLVPTMGFLVPIVLAAVAFVPWVTAYFEPFVRQAREDVKAGVMRASRER